jgi:hypothetical protein
VSKNSAIKFNCLRENTKCGSIIAWWHRRSSSYSYGARDLDHSRYQQLHQR